METRIAKLISFIFHPLLLPSYAFLVIFNLNTYISFRLQHSYKILLLFTLAILTFFLPLFIMFISKQLRLIKSFQMESRQERFFPYLVMAIVYALGYFFTSRSNALILFSTFFTGSFYIVIIAILINSFWKISIHMLGMGGLTAAILSIGIMNNLNIAYLVMLLFLFSGLTGFARLKLLSHIPAHIYSGFLIGFVIMTLAYYWPLL